MPRICFLLSTFYYLLSTTCYSASFFPEHPFSSQSKGTTGAAFLQIPMGARAEALGQSYAASMAGAESLFWNPAGLSLLSEAECSELILGYNRLLETGYSGSLAYAKPLPAGVLGLGWTYFSQGSIESFNTLGDPTGGFTPYDMAFSLSFSRMRRGISLGGTLKGIRSQISTEGGSTFAFDLGLIRSRATELGNKRVDIGFLFQNLGAPLKIGSAADPLPFKVQAGLLWYAHPRVIGALDVHAPVNRSPYASFGAEFRYPWSGSRMITSARAGYSLRNTNQVDGLSGMTAGFGLGLSQLRLDYAWVPFGDLGQTHRISMTFAFGAPLPSLVVTQQNIGLPQEVPNVPTAPKPVAGTPAFSIAVLDFKTNGVRESDASEVALLVQDGLVQAGLSEVMKRESVLKVLKERGSSELNCSTAACAVRLGKLLNAGRVVLGSLTLFKKGYYIEIFSINVQTGESEFSDTAVAWTERDLWETSVRLGKRLGNNLRSRVQYNGTP
ncbi:MAG: PorV/PorQ family protein [Elusimicrobia bacterium]|nr:PorV/PorQ family protein [Elusimicrobiota bacterium]